MGTLIAVLVAVVIFQLAIEAETWIADKLT